MRVGVFVCECGGNISDVVDVGLVEQAFAAQYTRRERYLCSEAGQRSISKAIKTHELERVVIAACSPRLHEQTFEGALSRGGLSPYLLERVDLREGCSWVHQDGEAATKKAVRLVRGAVGKLEHRGHVEGIRYETHQGVLVIGGGISGMTAALQLSADRQVILVERRPSIGGNMARLTKLFPTLDCAQCSVLPRLDEAARDTNIKLLTSSQLTNVSGAPGRFRAVVRSDPGYVDGSRCTGCGDCEVVCPVEALDEFELGLRRRKAIYRHFSQAVPRTYHLDKESCTGCGLCVEACKPGAIDLDAKEEERVFQVGAIVLATGYELFDASFLKEYGRGIYTDVLTALELERMMNLDGPTKGQVQCQDGRTPQRVAFIACVGSRDGKRGLPYCSKICCMYAVKQARLLSHMLRGVDVWVFYTDIRAAGKGYEEFYALAQEEGIVFNRGKVAAVQKDGNALLVRAENTVLGELVEERFDLVILCPAMIGSGDGSLAKALGIPLSEGGFFAEIHPKLNPVDLKGGIMGCGCCLGPKDVRESITEAMAAAAQTSAFLGRGEVVLEPTYVAIDYANCDTCGKCLAACPSQALVKEEGRVKVEVTSCTGCGFCIPSCPTDALDYVLGSEAELMAQIDEILSDDPQRAVLCFLDRGIPYAVLDRLATERMPYPADTKMILVPSVARIKLQHLRHIFSRGCREVALIYSEMDDELEKALRRRIKGYEELIEDEFGPRRITFFKVYAPQHEKLAMFLNMLGRD